MRRFGMLAALTALCLLLGGCKAAGRSLAPSGPGSEPAQAQDVPGPNGGAEEEYLFVISRDAPELVRFAATYFCEELAMITDSAVRMTVAGSIAPDAELVTGRAQMAFLNKKRQFEFSPPLAATALPFLYSGYRNFTMRANSPTTLELLERSLRESHKMVPLAAYYQGSRHLLSHFSVEQYGNFENERVAVSDDAEMVSAFTFLGAEAVVADTDGERFDLFLSGEASAAELSLDELAARGGELDSDTAYTFSSHSLVPVWLIAGEAFYDSLTDAQRAGVAELCAYITNLLDNGYVARETELEDAAANLNITFNTEFSSVRNRVFNVMPVPGADAGAAKKLARDLVEVMRRL